MKIIDAHLHIFPSEPRTDAMAEKVGHVNSVDHLREVYGQLEIVHGVVMVEIDREANNVRGKVREISKAGCKVKAFVIPTNEELVIARDTLELIKK